MSTLLLAVVSLVAAALCIGALLLYEANQARACTWREAAKAVEMTDVVEEKGFLGFSAELRGRAGELGVRIEPYGTGRHVAGTRVFITGLAHASWGSPPRLPLSSLEHSPWEMPRSGFELRAEGVGSALAKAMGDRELEIGDESFDAVAYIQGSPPTVLAILDAETRGLLTGLLQGRVPTREGAPHAALKARIEVVDGELRAHFPEPPGQPATGQLPGAVVSLLTVARRLAGWGAVPDRLARNVRDDPVAGVRRANLSALVRYHPDEEVTRETLRVACQDDDEEVRLRAAIALGDEARDILRQTAFDPARRPAPLFDDGGADSRAARAIEALGDALTPSEAGELLQRSIEAGRLGAARAAIGVLGGFGEGAGVAPLGLALESDDTDLGCAAATSLGRAGGETAEAALIAALSRQEMPLVRRAAAVALGRCGSSAAVKPLQGVSGPFHIGAAARQAIAEIQSRLTGATPGQLSLADGGAGQLSLSEENTEGRVSMADEATSSGQESSLGGGEEQWPTDGDGVRREPGSEDARELPLPEPKGEAE